MTHTPTPWTVTFAKRGGDVWLYSVDGALDEHHEDNARRIVLCVDAHDDLVAALEALLDDDGLANREDARAALAAAKGSATPNA